MSWIVKDLSGLVNCTSNLYEGQPIAKNSKVDLIITADLGYQIKEIIIIGLIDDTTVASVRPSGSDLKYFNADKTVLTLIGILNAKADWVVQCSTTWVGIKEPEPLKYKSCTELNSWVKVGVSDGYGGSSSISLGDTIYPDEDYIITIYADSGYEIDLIDINGVEYTRDSDDSFKITMRLDKDLEILAYSELIYIEPEPEPLTYKSNNSINCTTRLSESDGYGGKKTVYVGDEINVDTAYSIDITTKDGYLLDLVNINNSEKNILDNKVFKLNIYSDTDIEIIANAKLIPIPIYYDFGVVNLTNCTSNINTGDSFLKGEYITIVLTANKGFKFISVIGFTDGYGGMDTYYSENKAYFNDDSTVFTRSFYMTNEYMRITSTYLELTEVEPEPEPEPDVEPDVEPDDIDTTNDIFIMSNEELKYFTKQNFMFTEDNKPSDFGVESFKSRKYIYDIFRLPYNVDSIKEPLSKTIVLGSISTDIKAKHLKRSKLVLDLGTVVVPEKYNNVFDYDGVECFINLPDVDKIKLDVNMIVGHTIRIEYVVNLYTRITTINIYSSFNDSIIYSTTFEIGDIIPHLNLQLSNIKQNTIKVDNNIMNSFIEVVRPKPIITDSVFGKQVNQFGMLNEYSGYIEIDNIILNNILCTDSEKIEIESLLKSGVVIE